MEEIMAAIIAFVLWRAVVAVLASVVVAALLAALFPGFHAAMGFGIVFLGMAIGLIWQAQSMSSPAGSALPQVQVSRPIAFLGLAFTGVVWVGLLQHVVGSALLAGVLMAASPVLLSPVVVAISKQPLTPRQLIFATVAVTSGFMAIHAVRGIVSLVGP